MKQIFVTVKQLAAFSAQCNRIIKQTRNIFINLYGGFPETDLNRYQKNWSPLHIAAAQGHLEFCKYIIQKVKDPNPKRRNDGISAFHLAGHNVYK